MIIAPIAFGLGSMVTGIGYLTERKTCHTEYTVDANYAYTSSVRQCNDATGWMLAYAGVNAVIPGLARFTVGDTSRALLYAAARGASITAASVIDWGSSAGGEMVAGVLGFAAPVALAVVDMATTPHREDLGDKPPAPAPEEGAERTPRTAVAPKPIDRPRITGISPIPFKGRENAPSGAGFSLTGTF